MQEEYEGLKFLYPEGEYDLGAEISYRIPIFKKIPIGNSNEGFILGFTDTQIVVFRTKTSTEQVINRSQIIPSSKR